MSEKRRLRIVIAAIGGVAPAIAAVLLAPATDGCGSTGTVAGDGAVVATGESGGNDAVYDTLVAHDTGALDATEAEAATMAPCPGGTLTTYVVDIPPPGVPADPAQICAIMTPPVSSNTSARVTLTSYSAAHETAVGFVAIPTALQGRAGAPTLTVTMASDPAFAAMVATSVSPVTGGYTFQATWPGPLPHPEMGGQMTVKASFSLACDDGGSESVEAITQIDFCIDGDTFAWVSSGDACTVCRVIAEMAPSPIVPDGRGDDLPLGRVLRLRVLEIARAGSSVLLLADNDGGEAAEYDWRVSGGTLELIADDLVLWTPSGDGERPFGQVAVWNDSGAAVENFLWGAS